MHSCFVSKLCACRQSIQPNKLHPTISIPRNGLFLKRQQKNSERWQLCFVSFYGQVLRSTVHVTGTTGAIDRIRNWIFDRELISQASRFAWQTCSASIRLCNSITLNCQNSSGQTTKTTWGSTKLSRKRNKKKSTDYSLKRTINNISERTHTISGLHKWFDIDHCK